MIPDQAAFETALGFAIDLAAEDMLVTFGIKPTSPETGYGYIKKGTKVQQPAVAGVGASQSSTATSTYLAPSLGSLRWASGSS